MPESTNPPHAETHRHQLAIVGSGIFSFHQLTLETIQELEQCDVVCHLTIPEVDAYLRATCRKVVSLYDLYRTGTHNGDVYERIVENVMREVRANGRVAYMVLGHPALYDRSCRMLRESASADGYLVRTFAAVSALDTLLLKLAELGVDIGESGVQIYEANHLKSCRFPLVSTVPLLVFQLGMFGTKIITRNRVSVAERFVPLVDYLERFYPSEHLVEVLECSLSERHRTVRRSVPLRRLPELAQYLNYNSTLYVPRTELAEVVDKPFERSLRDPILAEKLLVPQ